MKEIATLLLACLAMVSASAGDARQGIKTKGDGTTYTLGQLSQLEGSGVTKVEGGFRLERNDTIAAGDVFRLDEGVTVWIGNEVQLVIQGEAQLEVAQTTTLTRLDAEAIPYGLRLDNATGGRLKNVVFEYAGLECTTEGAVRLEDCSFLKHNGSSAAALYFITAGETATISNCSFTHCERAAIGSAANASQPMTIVSCNLLENSTRNQNVPQINITAASPIVITDCRVLGTDASLEANNMVGGIGVSNFFGLSNTQLEVSHCTISHNRYGIGLVGPVSNVRIEDNQIDHNNHEANPMNGGSGISLYDPYGQTCAAIARNQISGNHWGITVIGCKTVNAGCVEELPESFLPSSGGNVFQNNGFDGQPYDLYNNSTITVYAKNNMWGVAEQTEELIESVIFHKADDEKLGQVVYMPAADPSAVEAVKTGFGADNRQQTGRYTLGGQAVKTWRQHGIVISNGKKYMR